MQNGFYDFDNPSKDIVVVAIDEKSLDKLGPLTQWKRSLYASAIEILNSKGASAIGVDITFPDRSLHGPADDDLLASTLKTADNVIMAGRYFFEQGERQFELPNENLKLRADNIGWINVGLDRDGFVRQIPIYTQKGIDSIEAFSLSIARKHLKFPFIKSLILDGDYKYGPGIDIPVITKVDKAKDEAVHLMYINYSAEPGKFTRMSFSDLLSGINVDRAGNMVDFKDKIVLIGPTAIDLQDHYLSPVSSGIKMPGVEIHANNIQTIVEKQFLRDQSRSSLWLMLLLVVAVNMAIFARLKVRYAIPLFLLETFGFMVAGIIAYESLIFLNVVYPGLALTLTFVGTYLLRFILEQKDRKFIEGAFGHYVNKSVVKKILKDPKSLELGGEKKEMTIFFSDIANFTTISENLDPGELVHFLNGYLQDMTQVVLEQEGTLDKYEGDAIMAFWNAPVEVEDHAKKACHAALNQQKRMAELRKQWKAEGKPEMHIRIGINTGEAVAGNMGSEDRFDYTVMGDDVNLASRLEGINKQYGTEVMLSEETYNKINGDFVCRELDLIRVKGKKKPVRIYELVGLQTEVSTEDKKKVETYEKALNLYREKKFEEAKKIFEGLEDMASKVFVDRCSKFLNIPPSDNWDGVFTFTSK